MSKTFGSSDSEMLVAPRLLLLPTASKFGGVKDPPCSSPKLASIPCSRPSSKTYCAKKQTEEDQDFQKTCSALEQNHKEPDFQGFSVLSSDIPWESGSIWSTMGAYFFGLHIPLGFGGLSIVSKMLHQPVLDPQTIAVSLVLIQTMELWGASALLCYTAKHPYKPAHFFLGSKISKQRSWIMASAAAFGFLVLLVIVTSVLADILIGPKDVNNPILKEILLSGPFARTSCFLVYCFITPLLEETVYRGFLLTSLASGMKWQWAVVISACVFSAAHLSPENSVQLFLIGCILGATYCWTGKLSSSFAVHSLYNAVTLLATILL